MLATEVKNLRWMGIDFHARWRRRVAVVVTYLGFLLLVSACNEIDTFKRHPFPGLLAVAAATLLLKWLSVFRDNGLVKTFEDKQSQAGGKYMYIDSLDGWARYRYGAATFESATPEQQDELLRRYRVGRFRVPAKPIEIGDLDERERAERNDAFRWTLNRVSFFLCIYAVNVANSKHYGPLDGALECWMIVILLHTLPQARVLWTESDPINPADPQLVESEA